MALYFIAIGGSGSRCLSSVVHLSAAGLVPEKKIVVRVVDPDVSNGSVARATQTAQQYSRARDLCRTHEQTSVPIHPMLRTKLDCSANEILWSPFRDNIGAVGVDRNLAELFAKNTMIGTAPGAAHLMDFLFTHQEQTESLSVGFRGRPAIGAAVFSAAVTEDGFGLWDELLESMKVDAREDANEPISVCLVGSIFGGTGASGIPTLGRSLRKKAKDCGLQRVRIGAVLMLPYFSFNPGMDGELAANSSDFNGATASALKYYRARALDTFDAIYLLGESQYEHVKPYHIGGENQDNPPLLTELLAASAAADFSLGMRAGFVFAARENGALVRWKDLPYISSSETLQQIVRPMAFGLEQDSLRLRLLQLLRFSVLLQFVFRPLIIRLAANLPADSRLISRVPWYIDFFMRPKLNVGPRELEKLAAMSEYALTLLRWFVALSDRTQVINPMLASLAVLFKKPDTKPNENRNPRDYVDLAALQLDIEVLELNFFDGLLKGERLDVNEVWARVCAVGPTSKGDAGMENLFRAIYDACGEEQSKSSAHAG